MALQPTRQNQIVSKMINERPKFETAESYYEGTQGEVFYGKGSNFRRDLASSSTDRTTLNFMRPIVDNVANRLEIEKIVGEQEVTKAVEKIRIKNGMDLLEKEIHRNALAMGEYYAMVWAKNGEVKVSIHDPRDTIVIYDPETGEKLLGARLWFDELYNRHKLNVFYPDRVEKYATKGKQLNYDDSMQLGEITAGAQWLHEETIENPFGEVPLFHFRTHGETGRPEHYDGYSIQDAINKLTVTHMITVDFQGAPQRYALKDPNVSDGEMEDWDGNETDREQKGIQFSPATMLLLQGFKAVGQFEPAKPEVFTAPIDHHVKSLAAVTNTPLHYFQATGNVPSGNALRAAEGPLLKKVADRQIAFGKVWDELYTFAVRIELNRKNADLVIHWKSVETLDLLEVWDVIAKKRNAGMPFEQTLIEAGYDEKTIKKIIEMKQKEEAELPNDYQRNSQQGKATNTNPAVRTNLQKDETSIPTGG